MRCVRARQAHPEYFRLALPGEDLGAVSKLLPEQLILRWLNHHIRKHTASPAYRALPVAERTVPPNFAVANLSTDLADGTALSLVMMQLHPPGLTATSWRELRAAPALRRAEAVLADAATLGCRRFSISPADITAGQPKPLLGFLADLMGTCSGLEAVAHDLLDEKPDEEEQADDREGHAYKCWFNSLGLATESNDLLEDCTTGLPLLRIMDKLWPGCIDYKRANATPRNVHERVENCNYALEVAKARGMKVMGIGGKDIADGSTKLTLAILWQLMRADVMKFLESLGMSERDIVRYANQRVASTGSTLRIERCGDKSISNGCFLLQLLRVVAPDCVDEARCYASGTPEECLHNAYMALSPLERKLNAQYAISCAHKIGCRVFLSWEDIVQVRPKMILTLLAAAMQQDMLRRNLGRDQLMLDLEEMKREELAVAKAAPASRGQRGKSATGKGSQGDATGCLAGLKQSLGLGPKGQPVPPPSRHTVPKLINKPSLGTISPSRKFSRAISKGSRGTSADI